MLNAARLDYDERIDLDKLKASVGGQLTRYEISNTPQEVLERVEGHAVVVNKEMPLGGDLIRAFPPCVKLICEAGTGYNNIDLVAARDMNIQVANVPTYATDAMSHMAITFVMALSCSLVPQAQSLATGDRSYLTQCHLGSLPHFELTHKTIGLIGGLGTIGKRVTAICHALGMNVLVTSTSHPLGPLSSSSSDSEKDVVTVVSMDDLMTRSDFVSIHCPLNDSTKHLVDASAISKMKPTSFLINTARGSIIDQTALIQALQNKTIAGAALDVFGTISLY
jgi:glycerate dehydrogenase